MNEGSALQALKHRDEQALAWFIDRYAGYVNTIVCNIIGSDMTHSDVEEVSSDVFLTLWSNAGRIMPSKVKAYLSGVARNKAKEKRRNLGTDVPLEDDLVVIADTDLERDAEQRELSGALRCAVLAMQAPDREIFLRHYYYYQSVARIAEEMGMNVSTVKTRLQRGRNKLKEALAEGGFDIGKEDIRPDGFSAG